MTQAQAKEPKAGEILHVVDNTELFRWRDDAGRVSPPIFLKWPVGANDEMTVRHLHRRERVIRGQNGLLFWGGFDCIAVWANNRGLEYRGYVTNDRGRPATVKEIADYILFCSEEEAQRIIEALVGAGLLEWVPEPNWEEVHGRLALEAEKVSKEQKRSGRSTSWKNRGKPGNLRKDGHAYKERSKVIESEGIARDTVGIEGKKEPGAKVQAKSNTPHPPAAAPSTSSASCDAGGGPPLSGRRTSPASISTVGQVLKLSQYRYNPIAWAFADGVLLASGYADCDKARRECERAHWARAWEDVASKFPPAACERLKQLIVEQAAALHDRRHEYGNPEAYLLRSWQNNVRDVKRAAHRTGSG
jgi:hypothetical protein